MAEVTAASILKGYGRPGRRPQALLTLLSSETWRRRGWALVVRAGARARLPRMSAWGVSGIYLFLYVNRTGSGPKIG